MNEKKAFADKNDERTYIESVTKKHDLYDFETRVNYYYDKIQEENEYSLSLFFFIPKSLRINENFYSSENFYSDLNNRTRFKTPRMALFSILSRNNSLSPLTRIGDYLDQIKETTDVTALEKKIIYELKMLGTTIRASVSDQLRFFILELESLKNVSEYIEEFISYISEIDKFQAELRTLRHKFLVSKIEENTREAFNFVDEFISLQIQDELTKALSHYINQPNLESISKTLIKSIEYERKHRIHINSHLIRNPNNDNQEYVYWEGILKRYVENILYLDLKDVAQRRKALQLFYSIAAGSAMFFSLLLGFWIAGLFEQNSLPFIIALVVAYIFKDRIKDNIKSYSNKIIRFFFPDRTQEIFDNKYHKKVGIVKEFARFLNDKDVPEEVMKIRHYSNLSPIEKEGKPEIVFRYTKKMKILGNTIRHMHQRHAFITDIIRFNLRQFLQYADDPYRDELLWNIDTKTLESIACSKVYHLNIIVKVLVRTRNEEINVDYKKIRVIFNQQGIQKVEEIRYS